MSSSSSLLNFEYLAQKYQNHIPQISQIHTLLITTGFLSSTATSRRLRPPTSIYNILIKSCLHHPTPSSPSFHLFTQMLSTHAPPSAHTFPSLVKASSASPSPDLTGPTLHAQVIRRGFHQDAFVGCSLVGLYSDLGRVRDAHKVFVEMGGPDCASCNAMLDGFFKNGEVGSAVGMFEGLPVRDVVSWTTMVNGFVRNRRFDEAVWWFGKMVEEQGRPNEATIVCGLSACANCVGEGWRGREIHGFIVRLELEVTAFVGTALVDVYGKYGNVCCASRVFGLVMKKKKKVCTWNAMISALACNGKESQALDMFGRMMAEEFSPNEITFVAVLTACARASLVQCGLRWFESMSNDFGLAPTMKHYGCMIDLFGRAGLLEEAIGFVRRMPFDPDASVLGALLGACKVHGDVRLANEVGQRLLALQPLHSGRYMVLSNVYAGAGMWATASELKEDMEKRGIKKIAGYSKA